MLSTLLHRPVRDRTGAAARVVDMVVDLAAGDHPPVTALLVEERGGQRLLSGDQDILLGDDDALFVPDLDAARPIAPDALDRLVLLRRDVLDALVIDVAHRRVTRANDLWLAPAGGRVVLAAVDTSAGAVWRRLSRGRLASGESTGCWDWRDIEFLRGAPAAPRRGRDYHRRIARLQPAQIARLAEAVPYLYAAELLTLLPDPLAADVLEVTEATRQLQVFEELPDDEAVRLLALMAPDVAADLVGRLGPARARALLEAMPPARAARLIELLRYAEDTVGAIMTNDVVAVPEGLTAGEATRFLRDRLCEPDFVYFVYVVADETSRRLVGVLTLRDLLAADPAQPLADLMRRDPEALGALEDARAGARRVTESHLAALPVVGRGGALLGAVTVDAAIALIAPGAWRAQAPRVFS